MSKITTDEIEKVARLSRLALSAEETPKFADQLNAILEYADKLGELNTSSIEPTSHSLALTNVFREDAPRPSLPPEDALSNAPDREDQCFKVPQIIQG